MSGSGSIDAAADIKNKIDANFSGSSFIYLEGDSYYADYEESRSSRIEGFNMEVDNKYIDITGSGR